MDKNIKTIAIICGIFVIVISMLGERVFHYSSESKDWKELAENSMKLGEKQQKTLNSLVEDANHYQEIAKDAFKQRDEVIDLAERAAKSVEKSQKQLRVAMVEIDIYQERVAGYIKALVWYEKKFEEQRDGE